MFAYFAGLCYNIFNSRLNQIPTTLLWKHRIRKSCNNKSLHSLNRKRRENMGEFMTAIMETLGNLSYEEIRAIVVLGTVILVAVVTCTIAVLEIWIITMFMSYGKTLYAKLTIILTLVIICILVSRGITYSTILHSLTEYFLQVIFS